MSVDYELSVLSKRFLRIVEVILQNHGEDDDWPKTESEISKMISEGKDRGILSRIKGGHNEPSQNHIHKLATLFNIDFNAFYRDIDTIFFDPDLFNIKRSISGVEHLRSDIPDKKPRDGWLEIQMAKIESFFVRAELYTSQMPLEISQEFANWLNDMKLEISKTQTFMLKELKGIRQMKTDHTEEILSLALELKESNNHAMKHMQKCIDLLERTN